MSENTEKCQATMGPDDEDPYIYLCNRQQPHVTLHAHLGPDGEPIAIWCTCGECNVPPGGHRMKLAKRRIIVPVDQRLRNGSGPAFREETNREYWMRKGKGIGLAVLAALADVLLVGSFAAMTPSPLIAFFGFNVAVAAMTGALFLFVHGLNIAFPDL